VITPVSIELMLMKEYDEMVSSNVLMAILPFRLTQYQKNLNFFKIKDILISGKGN
jgi:hypothetical protein